MNRCFYAVLIVQLLLPLLTCGKQCQSILKSADLNKQLAEGSHIFSFNLYKKLGAANHGVNVVISPFSIRTALAMTTVGAEGNTLKQMYTVLQFKCFQNPRRVNRAFLSLLSSMCPSPSYNLTVANRMYVENDFNLQSTFINTFKRYYMSDAVNVNFLTDARNTTDDINGWVEQTTNGVIKNLFKSPLPQSTSMVVVNAIFFKGIWQHRFDSNDTKSESFILADGQSVDVPMMHLSNKFNYYNCVKLGSQVLQMDYQGNRLLMYVILPYPASSLSKLRAQLSSSTFKSCMQSLSMKRIKVILPKLKIKFHQQLNDILKALGITDLFDPNLANLSGMTDTIGNELHVSSVMHQANIEIDEKGTVATATTGVVMIPKRRRRDIEFKANRPFFFIIYDTEINQILFMGNIYDPLTD